MLAVWIRAVVAIRKRRSQTGDKETGITAGESWSPRERRESVI